MTDDNIRNFYDILEVPISATTEDIQKSYRKLVKINHPDRNINDIENATKKFKAISAAYETLSDKQSRAWYDTTLSNTNEGDIINDIMLHFSKSCYNTNNFFNVYKSLFDKITADEMKYCSPETKVEIPSFNNYDKFYKYFENFSTIKKLVYFKPKHDLSELYSDTNKLSRRVRRELESENTKSQITARKQYNELVRKLINIVKQRDGRYILKTKQLQQEQRQKEEVERKIKEELKYKQMLAKEQLKQERLIYLQEQQEYYKELELEKIKLYGTLEDDNELNNNNNDILFSCDFCNKKFKSEGQFNNHINSKKHKDIIEYLTKNNANNNNGTSLVDNNSNNNTDINTNRNKDKNKNKNKNKKKVKNFDSNYENDTHFMHKSSPINDDNVDSMNNDDNVDNMNNDDNFDTMNNDDNDDGMKDYYSLSEESEFETTNLFNIISDSPVEIPSIKKNSSRKKINKEFSPDDISNNSDEQEITTNSDSKVIDDLASLDIDNNTMNTSNNANFDNNYTTKTENSETNDSSKVIKKSKKSKINKTTQVKSDISDVIICKYCNKTFDSKTKLHQHLRNFPKHQALK